MPITEIALLHLSPHVNIEDAGFRSKLAHAKKVMQDYTGRIFYFYQQIEDPSQLYIFGEWDSLDQHMNDFIPSEANQKLLDDLKNDVAVEWLQHINTPHSDLPLVRTDFEQRKALAGDTVISVGRHFIKEGSKDAFWKTFDDNKHHLQDYLTKGTMGGGWRIDTEGNKEEWVLLCPYTSVRQHQDFVSTPGFEKFSRIRAHIEGAEIKHAKLLNI